MAGGVISTSTSGSQGLLCPRSRSVVLALAFCNVLKEKGHLSMKLALDVIGGFVKGAWNSAEPLESIIKTVIEFTCLPIDHRPPERCGCQTHKTRKYHLKEPICQPVIKSEIDQRIVLVVVGYSHLPCSFPYVYVDSSLILCGRPVRAAIHLLVS